VQELSSPKPSPDSKQLARELEQELCSKDDTYQGVLHPLISTSMVQNGADI
jgi:hypothetical protein